MGEGTPVAWQLPTTLEALVLCAALARLGAVQVPILPILRAREVGFAVRQTGARRLFVPETFRSFDFASMARAIAAELPGLAVEIVAGALPGGRPGQLARTPAGADCRRCRALDLLHLRAPPPSPKGARHTDATLLAAARGMSARLELAPDDRVGLVFPVTHVGGVLWLMNGLLAGCAQIAVASFDPRSSIDVLARHGVTQAGAGTAFHQAYLAAQRERGGAPIFPRVRAFPGGGAPKPPQSTRRCEARARRRRDRVRLRHDGVPRARDGLPARPRREARRTRRDARCPPEVQIRVVDGEMRVRAPQLFRGYLDARLDAEAFDADGFFRTGDLGHLDADGYVVVTGRLKDVIIRKGENISARELEDLLHAHPAVREVAVIGLPDPDTGERACAVVVPADPERPPSLAGARGLADRAATSRSRSCPSSSSSSPSCRATRPARSSSRSCARASTGNAPRRADPVAPRERLSEIDFIKAAAIVAVVFTHAGPAPWQPTYTTLDLALRYSWNSFQVPAFLLVAGFLYQRPGALAWREVARRLRRILIPYLIASGICLGMGFWNPASVREALVQLVTAQTNGIYYFIRMLALCVAVFWPLSRLTPGALAGTLAVIACAAAALGIYGRIMWFGYVVPPYTGINLLQISNSVLYPLTYFGIGWVTAAFSTSLRARSERLEPYGLAAGLAGIACWIAAAPAYETLIPFAGVARALYSLSVVGVLAITTRRWRVPAAILFLSEASLGIYLYHILFEASLAPRVAAWPPLLRISTCVAVDLAGGAAVCLLARRLLGARLARTLVGA